MAGKQPRDGRKNHVSRAAVFTALPVFCHRSAHRLPFTPCTTSIQSIPTQPILPTVRRLASCAIGLTTLTTAHLDLMVPAVLKSFSDQEPRVRYYACESLFNIIKICRGGVLPWLNEVFTGVCKLVADVDAGGCRALSDRRHRKSPITARTTIHLRQCAPRRRLRSNIHSIVTRPPVRRLQERRGPVRPAAQGDRNGGCGGAGAAGARDERRS